jgi:hypothetical protein
MMQEIEYVNSSTWKVQHTQNQPRYMLQDDDYTQ